MKKTFLLSFLLYQLTFVFGQNIDWGSWTPVSCYSRLSTSVLGNGYVPSIKEYSWQIRIKSTYSKKVTFNMTWIVGGERLSIGQVTLSPNESYGHTPRYFKSSSNNIVVEVSEVCFEGQDCYKYGYADCNGNQAKISNNSSSTNSTNSTNQTSNSSQQNDLTEYNNSKADLERQIQEKNAQGQQKSQNYTTAMNAGISAHNSGNYTEAKKQFSIALNNCNTEEAKSKAQEYYSKSVDAEKSQEKIKITGDLVQTGVNSIYVIADAIGELKEKKEEQKKDDYRKKNSENLVSDELLLSLANDVVDEFQKKGFHFINNLPFSYDKKETDTKSLLMYFNGFTVSIGLIYLEEVMHKSINITTENTEVFSNLKKKKILEKYEDKKAPNGYSTAHYTQSINDIFISNAHYSLASTASNKNYITFVKNENYPISNKQPATELTSEQLLEKAEDILDKYKGTSPKKSIITEDDQTQAISYLKQAISLGNKDAYQDLYFVYEKIGDYKSARYYINEEIHINPEATYPLLKMGYYYQDGTDVEKNYTEAEKFYNKVLSIDNNDISANYKLGEIYRNGGYGIQQDLAKAKAFYKKPCDFFKFKAACEKYNSIE